MNITRYVLFSTKTNNPEIEGVLKELSKIRIFVVQAIDDQFNHGQYIHVDSELDPMFGADIQYEYGYEVAEEVEGLLDSPELYPIRDKKFDGIVSITYLNDDDDEGGVRERLESVLKSLVAGMLYIPEEGRVI